MAKKPKAKRLEYRRRSDGYRVKLTAAELAEIHGADDFELYDDYVKGQLAPPKRGLTPAQVRALDRDGNGEAGGSLPADDDEAPPSDLTSDEG